jgi:hypothetical protein
MLKRPHELSIISPASALPASFVWRRATKFPLALVAHAPLVEPGRGVPTRNPFRSLTSAMGKAGIPRTAGFRVPSMNAPVSRLLWLRTPPACVNDESSARSGLHDRSDFAACPKPSSFSSLDLHVPCHPAVGQTDYAGARRRRG